MSVRHEDSSLQSEGLRRLLRDLGFPEGLASAEHLSDEELVLYGLGELSPEQEERADRHLNACRGCASAAEKVAEAVSLWRSEVGRRRLDMWRDEVLERVREKEMAAHVRELTALLERGPVVAKEELRECLRRLQSLLGRALARWPSGLHLWLEQAGLAAAPAGERALHLNSLLEVPLEWVKEPTVDGEGRLVMGVRLDLRGLAPEGKLFLDILFLPTAEQLLVRELGPGERLRLESPQGLELICQLPEPGGQTLAALRSRLAELRASRLLFPRAAFALRLWTEG
jgi:hypothetical protein